MITLIVNVHLRNYIRERKSPTLVKKNNLFLCLVSDNRSLYFVLNLFFIHFNVIFVYLMNSFLNHIDVCFLISVDTNKKFTRKEDWLPLERIDYGYAITLNKLLMLLISNNSSSVYFHFFRCSFTLYQICFANLIFLFTLLFVLSHYDEHLVCHITISKLGICFAEEYTSKSSVENIVLLWFRISRYTPFILEQSRTL